MEDEDDPFWKCLIWVAYILWTFPKRRDKTQNVFRNGWHGTWDVDDVGHGWGGTWMTWITWTTSHRTKLSPIQRHQWPCKVCKICFRFLVFFLFCFFEFLENISRGDVCTKFYRPFCGVESTPEFIQNVTAFLFGSQFLPTATRAPATNGEHRRSVRVAHNGKFFFFF